MIKEFHRHPYSDKAMDKFSLDNLSPLPRINLKDSSDMVAPVRYEEIKEEVFSMEPLKALGPNGLYNYFL